MPVRRSAPKSACSLSPVPMWRRNEADRGSTGSVEISWFQSFETGKTGQPAMLGPGGSARGTGTGPASGVAVDPAPCGLLPPQESTTSEAQKNDLTRIG